MGLTPSLALYIGGLGFAGLVCAVAAATRLSPGDLPGLLVMVALVTIAERINLPLPRGGELSPGTMVSIAAIILLPPEGAVVVGFTGMLVAELVARKAWFKVVFNVGQNTVIYAAAALVWWLAGGGAVQDARGLLDALPGAFAAIVTYYLLNTTLVCTVLVLTRGGRIWDWDFWSANHFSVLLPHMGMQVMGILFALAWLFDWRAMVLLAVPAGITWTSFRFIHQLRQQAEQERLLRTESEQHAARWAALADVADRLGATVVPAAALEAAAELAIAHVADAATVVLADGRTALAVRPGTPDALHQAVAVAAGAAEPPEPGSGLELLPLLAGGERVGVLTIGWVSGYPDDERVALRGAIVDRIALALHQAVLVEQSAEVEALRALTRLKNEFLAKVSHELHAPLSLVVGYGELLYQQSPGEDQARWMGERILRAGQHLARLVNDLTDAGRLEAGRFSLDLRGLDLPTVVDAAIEAARTTSCQNRFVSRIATELPPVEADASRVQQVLTNLLTNAARYGLPDGEIRVLADAFEGNLLIAVEDDGPGVPVEERRRIFDKFYRAQGANERSRKGLGLGLAIAQDIVCAHGGEIWVEDAPSGGARFAFVLPGGRN